MVAEAPGAYAERRAPDTRDWGVTRGASREEKQMTEAVRVLAEGPLAVASLMGMADMETGPLPV